MHFHRSGAPVVATRGTAAGGSISMVAGGEK